MRPVKWILINGQIRMSHALYHKCLLTDDEHSCDGGGFLTVDEEHKTILFHGESDDFGKADKDKFMQAARNNRDELYNDIYFCTDIDTTGYWIVFQ